LYNGTIYTIDNNLSEVDAIAIRGDKIVGVGALADIKSKVGAQARMIDLRGKFMLPGLVDSHNHAIKGGERLLTADAGETLFSYEQLKAFAEDALESGRGARGNGLYITGIHSSQWTHIDMLDSLFNNRPYKNRPVMLLGMDGHTGWCNQFQLANAGVDDAVLKALPREQALFYGRNSNGSLSGFLSENAVDQIAEALPPSPITPTQRALNGVHHLNSLGITAWLDPSSGNIAEGLQNESLAAYAELATKNQLTAHVAATVVASVDSSIQRQILMLKNLQQKFNSRNISVLGFKLFADGVMEYPTQTAALSVPYTNSESSGSLLVDPGRLVKFVTRADKNNLLVHIHAIGDRAVSVSLDAIAEARRNNKNSILAHSITHLQIVSPHDYHGFAAHNVLLSMQLLWANADRYTIDLVQPYIDSALFQHQYPAMSLVRAGATLCGASDWPVTSANPFEAISIAETRKGELGILNAAETVPRIEMIKAYTRNSARLIQLENKIGSIEVGKQADFVLLDRDVMNVNPMEIKDTKVIWTMVGGEIVFSNQ
jgi:hypothetical protein